MLLCPSELTCEFQSEEKACAASTTCLFYLHLFILFTFIYFILFTACRNNIQTHKRLKRTLFIRTKHNMQIFGVIPFIKLQNDT